MPFRIGRTNLTIRVGEFLFAAAILLVSIAYLFDARNASLSRANLLLIEPLTVVIAALAFFIAIRTIRVVPAEAPAEAAIGTPFTERFSREIRIGILLVLTGAYVIFMERIGTDAASFLYIAAALYLQGERRWWALGPSAAVIAAAIVWLFTMMSPIPFSTLVVPG